MDALTDRGLAINALVGKLALAAPAADSMGIGVLMPVLQVGVLGVPMS